MSCSRCGGTGWYRYDHNHSAVCPDCCPHDEGVWQLLKYYGEKNGRWCCRGGCGTTWATETEYQAEWGV